MVINSTRSFRALRLLVPASLLLTTASLQAVGLGALVLDATNREVPQSRLSQATLCGTQTVFSQDFPDFGTEVMAADDFVVPAGPNWSIDRVVVFGVLAQTAGPTPTYDVTIYNDGAGIPGSSACTFSGLLSSTVPVAPSIDAGFKFDLPTTCDLGPGTYWLEVQVVMPSSDGVWLWESSTSTNGSQYVWQDPSNQFGTGCTSWTPHTSCLSIGGPDPDLCFALFNEGEVIDLMGPESTVDFAPNPIDAFEDGQLTATASEVNTGGANVVNIEFQLDGGSWMPMAPDDAAYDSIVESGTETINFATSGTHQACVRGTDALANPGLAACIDIEVLGIDSTPPSAPEVDVTPNPTIVDETTTLSITASDVLTDGSNIQNIEYQVDGGNWTSILTPVDGTYDESVEEGEVELTFDAEGLPTVCARATDSANNVSDPTCVDVQVYPLGTSLRLRAIEVNQVIQNWRNEVPLYQGKDTVVRVFLERINSSSSTSAKGALHGSINGSPLPGSPLPPDRNRSAAVADDATAFTVTSNSVDSWRADLRSSLNYSLPITWINQAGPIDLEFELTNPSGAVLACEEPDGNPDCAVSVTFDAPDRPLIEFFSVPYDRSEIMELEIDAVAGTFVLISDGRQSFPVPFNPTAAAVESAAEAVLNARDARVRVDDPVTSSSGILTFEITVLRGQDEELLVNAAGLAGSAAITEIERGGPTIAPGYEDLIEQVRRVSDVFPTNSVDFHIRGLRGFRRAPTLMKVNIRLEKARALDRIRGVLPFGMRSLAVILERGPTSTGGGLAWLKVSSTYTAFTEDPTKGGYARSRSAHEGAHTYGRAHAVTDFRFVGASPVGTIGICGAKAHLAATFTPFVEVTAVRNNNAIDESLRFTWPTIGPLALGPDDEIWGFSPRAFANGVGFKHLVIVDPRNSAELMSYCKKGGNLQNRWISSFTYDKLRPRLRSDGVDAPGAISEGIAGEYLLVGGSIDDETGEVEMEPATRLSGDDPGFEPGGVHIALVDSIGIEIAARDVALLVDGNHESLSDGPGPEPAAFFAAVPVPDGTTPAAIVVTLDTVEIARVDGSANPPTVQLTSPAGGSLATETIPIAWDASDLDGDFLTTSILFSIDDGATWETLAVDIDDTSYDAPTRFLEESNSALVKVLVSDGFHTAEATSDTFSVDAGNPLASVEIPVNGIAIEPGGVLRLKGDGWDPEEGLLGGTALAWASDQDGALGSGEALDLDTSLLTLGCHVVTLTATDSDARSGTDTTEVDIGATGCLGLFFADGFESGDTASWSAAVP